MLVDDTLESRFCDQNIDNNTASIHDNIRYSKANDRFKLHLAALFTLLVTRPVTVCSVGVNNRCTVIGSRYPGVTWRHMQVCNMHYLTARQNGKALQAKLNTPDRFQTYHANSWAISYFAVNTTWFYLQLFHHNTLPLHTTDDRLIRK